MRILIGIASVLLVIGLAGCSAQETSTNYTVEPYADESIGFDTEIPSIRILSEDSFIIIDGGSGSCRNVIESVEIIDTKLQVNYVPLPPDTACTMDFVIDPQKVTFNSPQSLTTIETAEITTIMGNVVSATVTK